MLCPKCKKQTKVLESRIATDNISTRRRRECLKCSFRFSTIEGIVILDLMVLKRNNQQEKYSKDKLKRGLKRSLNKKRATSENLQKLISDIEQKIQINAKNNAITSTKIGKIVMRHLKTFDKIAYVRFASIYMDFKNPQDFAKEVARLQK